MVLITNQGTGDKTSDRTAAGWANGFSAFLPPPRQLIEKRRPPWRTNVINNYFFDLTRSHNMTTLELAHKWVACWKHEKNTIIIEVYYAGSRENAPY